MQYKATNLRRLPFGCLLALMFLAIHSPANATLSPRDVDLTFAQNSGPVTSSSTNKLNLPSGQAPYTDIEPVFASDLHTIFYASDRAVPPATKTTGFHIWRTDSDGGFQLLVAGTTGTDQEWPSVSADGNGLAYSSRDANGRAQIHVLNLASGVDFQVTDGPGDKIHPTWSPLATIAFQDNETGVNKIWLVYPIFDATSTTSPRTQLTGVGSWDSANAATVDQDPAWEPGGGHIAFARNDGTHNRIWLISKPQINVAGAVTAVSTKQLTDFSVGGVGSDERYPAWRPQGPQYSPNESGSLIAFSSTRKTASTDPLITVNGATRIGSTYGIYRMPILYSDAGQDTPYTETFEQSQGRPTIVVAEDAQFGLTYQDITPAWSPDTRNDPVTGKPHIANRIVYASSSYAVTPPSDSPPAVIIPTPYPGSKPAYDLWSSELIDFTPPSLQGPPTVTPKVVGPGDTVTISAKFADLNAGVAHVYAQIKNPNSYLQDQRLPSLRNSLKGTNIGPYIFDGHRVYQVERNGFAPDTQYGSYQEVGYQPIDPVTYSYQDSSGNDSLPLDITTPDGILSFFTRDYQPPLTLELTRDPSDPSGATFSAPWRTDVNLDTDYVIDVIAVDRSNNAIDYDNVGGFSSKSFAAAKDSILLVADYTTPQRFLAPRGGQMPGEKYGVESWLTDNPLSKIGNDSSNGGAINPQYYAAGLAGPADLSGGKFDNTNNVDLMNLVAYVPPFPLPDPPLMLPNFLWGFANTLGLGSWIDLHYNGGLNSLGPIALQPGPVADTVATLNSAATAGSFTLSITYALRTLTTTAIPWNATALQVQTAIESLANVGYGDARTTGGALPTAINITFSGALAGQNVGVKVNQGTLKGGTVTLDVAPGQGTEDPRFSLNRGLGWPRKEGS
ncbi:MAG: hypothetical protein LC772_01380, partial [Chloroflexi bacterium]|nr:hypothetical protein [Chloroflexota bacterium]